MFSFKIQSTKIGNIVSYQIQSLKKSSLSNHCELYYILENLYHKTKFINVQKLNITYTDNTSKEIVSPFTSLSENGIIKMNFDEYLNLLNSYSKEGSQIKSLTFDIDTNNSIVPSNLYLPS
jgi:hypothetical protein